MTEAGTGVDAERRRLAAAIAAAQGQLAALRAQLHAKADPAKAAIFAAHEELLSDPDLLEIAESAIAKGKSAAFAWKKAVTTHADRLAGLRNQLLAQRANDLRDVGLRVLSILTGADIRQPEYPPNSVLIAEDLTPSDTAALDRSRVMGFCTTRGGATSHVAILARSLGIPALAGIEPAALEVPNGTRRDSRRQQGHAAAARLAGGSGPHPPGAGALPNSAARRTSRTRTNPPSRSTARASKSSPTSADSRMPPRSPSSAAKAWACCAPSSSSWNAPTRRREEEQFETYKAIAQAVGPDHPLIIRTLDVGGDKPLVVPADSEGGQSVPRRARRARRPRSPRDPAHAAPRDPARGGRSARSA